MSSWRDAFCMTRAVGWLVLAVFLVALVFSGMV